ncbi:dnaJ homolog subfamily C member 7-like isoform X2 [Babylonia areolata]|uniref:dnaJ homolog subfamily C member 7-like isoform X2 n=1 Tax=Babylonia areolata TaxID=304850 RepID=UPI003FD578FA
MAATEGNSIEKNIQSEVDHGVMTQEFGRAEVAESKKEEGNEYYKQQKYREALECYTQAINICPSCAAYYGNRAAANIMLKKYRDGLSDAQNAVQIDPTFVKGYIREGKCHMKLGNSMAASNSFHRVLELDPNNAVAVTELKGVKQLQEMESKVELNFVRGDHRTALYCLDRCLDHSPACYRLKVQKAEALALLGRHQQAQELANDVILRDALNADALYVRGLSMLYQDQTDRAFQHFQQVMRLAPDHRKAKDAYQRAKKLRTQKEAGNTAFREGRMQEAFDLYTQALQIDPQNSCTNSKLYCNRGTVCSKLNKLDQAIKDFTQAIDLDDSYVKAYLRRAKCYMDTEQYEEAVRDYEKIYKLQKSRDNKQLLRDAKAALKGSKRKDYYKILGVGRSATDDEIKKAYRKRALIHHPDRHAHASKEEQKKEEMKFKELSEAYSVLSDCKKRAQYDIGQDMDDMMNGPGGFADVDPDQIFKSFFGNMGFSGSGSGSAGMPHFPFGGPGPHAGPGGFPGSGFTFQFG